MYSMARNLARSADDISAIVTTGINYDLLFEVTYNGDKTETYLDVYKKWDQIRISLGEDSHG